MTSFVSRRSTAYGTKGVVASSQPLACTAGLEILNKGGNAADAAVAVAAGVWPWIANSIPMTQTALNVTEPCSTGLGGDMFMLFYNAQDKTVKGINGSGRAPKALNLQLLRDKGISGRTIPPMNINAATVPGAAAGFCDTAEHFGSGKLSLAELLDPAIRLAEEGFSVCEITAQSWAAFEGDLLKQSVGGKELLISDRAPRCGEIFTNPTLAESYRAIAREGRDGFYKGRIAQAIVDLVKDKGGVMTLEDLANHTSTLIEPISLNYQDKAILHECPPNGQGLTALVALGILQELEAQGTIEPLATIPHNSAKYLHYLIEALRLAFADTRYYVSDPLTNPPLEQLLSKTYLGERAKLIHPNRVTPVKHGNPVNTTDTTYFSVTDAEGNACSYICSNSVFFGTAAVPTGTGFALHNRASNFTLEEGHPNCIEGGKLPYHTIIPGMATLPSGELLMAFGVMGGFNQPQGHVQTFLNILRGMSPQEALDTPRFCIGATSFGAKSHPVQVDGKDVPSEVTSEVDIEDGVSDAVLEELRSMGHRVRQVKGWERMVCGRGQIIQRIPTKDGRLLWAAGSDPRGDGFALPQI